MAIPATETTSASSQSFTNSPASPGANHPGHLATIPALSQGQPPLKSRLKSNRNLQIPERAERADDEFSRSDRSTGPDSFVNSMLPQDAHAEISEHFWRLVEDFRPTDSIAVNAVLDLTICSWKFRRLFEQFACRKVHNRLNAEGLRRAKDKRKAQTWFRRLAEDARASLSHLERTSAGLELIVEQFDNLITELEQPDGFWTRRQFLVAINLGGNDDHEIWDFVELRRLWSAWFACWTGRKSASEESQSCTPSEPEYRSRARRAMENVPLPAEGRRQLIHWAQSMRDGFVGRLEARRRLEERLQAVDAAASGWPAPEETSQHLLYLRYSNQLDRKTREVHAILAARQGEGRDREWKFDDRLIPSDWRAVLLSSRTRDVAGSEPEERMRSGAGPESTPFDRSQVAAEERSVPVESEAKADESGQSDVSGHNGLLFEEAAKPAAGSPETDAAEPGTGVADKAGVAGDGPASHVAQPCLALSLPSRGFADKSLPVHELSDAFATSSDDPGFGIAVDEDARFRDNQPVIETHKKLQENCGTQESTEAKGLKVPEADTEAGSGSAKGSRNRPGPLRASKIRKYRHDKATDAGKQRHRHVPRKSGQPPEQRNSQS